MLTERQMLRAFDAAVGSGEAGRLCWAARAAFQYVAEAKGGPWFTNQIAKRLPAWRSARGRLNTAVARLDTEGDRAIESLALLLEGSSPVGMIGQLQLPTVESAENEAEAQALADYLGDEDRLLELRSDFVLPTEPEPVLVVGVIEFQGPPLVLMYHEGLIERPWGERSWRAEPALIEDAILMAFAIDELRDPRRTLDVVRRIVPHLRELDESESWEAGARAFRRLGRCGLLEQTGLDTRRASAEGGLVVATHLMPAWAVSLDGNQSKKSRFSCK